MWSHNVRKTRPIWLILVVKYLWKSREGLDGEIIWKNCEKNSKNNGILFPYKLFLMVPTYQHLIRPAGAVDSSPLKLNYVLK